MPINKKIQIVNKMLCFYGYFHPFNPICVWKTSFDSQKTRRISIPFSFPVYNCLQLAMVVKIKLFQSVRKSYQAIGLNLMQSNSTPTKFNQRILFIAFSILQLFMSSTAFFIFKAKTVQERATSFYASTSELLISIVFFTLITKMSDISRLIVLSEKFIEKSN